MTDQNTRSPNPYVGPRSLRVGEAIYGRSREVRQLLDLLIAERIVLLHSPSGAGKTSLIRAGLIPRLQEEGFQVLPVARMSLEPPAGVAHESHLNRYLFSFMLSCEEALPEKQRLPLNFLATIAAELGAMQRRPRRGFALLNFDDEPRAAGPGTLTREAAWQKLRSLDDYLTQRLRTPDSTGGEVLIIDQFEEILTCNPYDIEVKTAFFAQLGSALRDRRRWALFVIREDYLAALAPYVRHIPTRLTNTFRLDLLEAEPAREAVQLPARQANVNFTDAAARKLIDDLRRVKLQTPEGTAVEALGTYVDPVQLQVVCHRLWSKLPAGLNEIVEANIESIGDVDSALGDYYAAQVVQCAQAGGVKERKIRDWFDQRLISEQGIRLQVLMEPEASQGLENTLIGLLQNAYLVRTEKRGGATWFELSHDRLIKPVQANNAAWREAHLSPLQRQAALWDREGRGSGLLLRGDVLTAAEQWADRHAGQLTAAEQAFLDACRKARDQARAEQRKNRLIMRLAIYSTIGLIAVLLMAGVAGYFWFQANRQKHLATARQLSAASQVNLELDQERSLLLALQAADVTRHPGPFEQAMVLPEAEAALHRSLEGLRLEQTLVAGGEAEAVAYSPDGTRVAAGTLGGQVKIWEVASTRELATLAADDNFVFTVAFSPDGTRVATGGEEGLVKIWDPATGQLELTLTGHAATVRGVTFSPDGASLVTGSSDGTIRLWDAATGKTLQELAEPNDEEVYTVAYNPEGTRLLSTGIGTAAYVWDVEAGQVRLTLTGHTATIQSGAFSPDGSRIATASGDRTIKVWDAKSGEELFTLTGHLDYVSDVAFTPDGRQLVSSSMDRTVQVWDVEKRTRLYALLGHGDYVNELSLSADGTHVATASYDGTVKIWNLSPAGSRELFTVSQDGPIAGVAFSADGRRVATAGGSDNTAWVWEAQTGKAVQTFTGHDGPLEGVAFSPDGARLATASLDGTARIWDIASGQEVLKLNVLEAGANDVVFSPDGRDVATADEEGTVKIWDAATGEERLTLAGHTGRVNRLAYSADGQRLLSAGSDTTTRVWDTTSGASLLTVSELQDFAAAIFSPDGKQIVTSGEKPPKVWNAATGEEEKALKGHNAGVFGLAFSPDGKRLATASADRTLKLWDVVAGKALLTLYGHNDNVDAVAFSPDGRYLFSGSVDGTARMYVLPVDELITQAQSRVTRGFTADECQTYLPDMPCPAKP